MYSNEIENYIDDSDMLLPKAPKNVNASTLPRYRPKQMTNKGFTPDQRPYIQRFEHKDFLHRLYGLLLGLASVLDGLIILLSLGYLAGNFEMKAAWARSLNYSRRNPIKTVIQDAE